MKFFLNREKLKGKKQDLLRIRKAEKEGQGNNKNQLCILILNYRWLEISNVQYNIRTISKDKYPSTIELRLGGTIESIIDYSILRGVELIRSPIPVSYREEARSQLKEDLPKLKQLLSTKFYFKELYVETIQKAALEAADKIGSAKMVVSSPVDIRHIKGNDFGYPPHIVNYEQAIQFLRENGNRAVSVRGKQPFKFDASKGLLLDENADGIEGLAQVCLFSRQIKSADYFNTPEDLNSFEGDYTNEKLARRIFEELFRWNVTMKAYKIRDSKKVKVKGILLSDIKAVIGINDKEGSISPTGKFLLGVSYLV